MRPPRSPLLFLLLAIAAVGCGRSSIPGASPMHDGGPMDAGDAADADAADADAGDGGDAGLCGNGILEPGEECDDGNNLPGDGCGPMCIREMGVCGNGVLERGEECDDGNNRPGDGCSPRCTREMMGFCGNGVVEPGEECDDGNNLPGDGCGPMCFRETGMCGNGIVEPPEECDDGNRMGGDGCSPFCSFEMMGVCGNGIVEPPEECDDGNTTSGDGCDAMCFLEMMGVCGNGVVEPGEECDDGNTTSGDGCDAMCQLEGMDVCGDGVLDPDEECDDGNTTPGDGCDAMCRLEGCRPDLVLGTLPVGETVTRSVGVDGAGDDVSGCGAGTGEEIVLSFGTPVDADVELEILQAGDHVYGLYAEDGSGSCTGDLVRCFDPSGSPSGNTVFGELPEGEYVLVVEAATADGAGNASVALTVLADTPECGDGTVDTDVGEVCDDGNTTGGDGCSADCRSMEVCGNGVLDVAAGEMCDDGNTMDGDGCSSDCLSDETCGNGVVDDAAGEVCDDGNTRAGDGCSADCASDETCGNGIVDSTVGEGCDDGNTTPGDGCDGMCQVEPGVCHVDEDLGVVTPGDRIDRSFDVSMAGDEWETDCSASGPEVVIAFETERAGDILMFIRQEAMGHHNLGLYREGSVSETCVATDGFCGSTGPGEDLGIRFPESPAARYFLTIESNGEDAAGPVDLTLFTEGCLPDTDLGTLGIGDSRSTTADTRTGGTLFEAGCAGTSGRERVVAFQLAEEADLELTYSQTGDHVFGLFEEMGRACDELGVACHDPTGAPSGTHTFPRLPPGPYVFVVDAHDPGDEGSVMMTITAR